MEGHSRLARGQAFHSVAGEDDRPFHQSSSLAAFVGLAVVGVVPPLPGSYPHRLAFHRWTYTPMAAGSSPVAYQLGAFRSVSGVSAVAAVAGAAVALERRLVVVAHAGQPGAVVEQEEMS